MFRFTNLIIFELTRSCNLNCKYCYQHTKPKQEVISTDTFCRIIDRICEQRILSGKIDELLTLNFHGGECTLVGKEKFKAFAEYATKTFSNNGLLFKLGLQTNGSLLDDEWLDIFRYYNMSLGVSFDGLYEPECQRTSDSLRKKIYHNIVAAKKKGVQVGVLSVITSSNIDSLQKDRDFFRSKDICMKSNFVEDVSCPENSKYELSGKDIFEKFYKAEIDRVIKTGDLSEFHTKEFLFAALTDILTIHESSYDTGCDGRFCGAGITMIAVRPDGTMGYCDRYSDEFKENYIQNALDYDFLGLKQLNACVKFDRIKSNLLKETGCDSCRASYFCSTGCMAFYFSKFRKYGIQKGLICSQFLGFYDYVVENLVSILTTFKDKEICIESPNKILDFSNYWEDRLFKQHFLLEKVDDKFFRVKEV